MSYIGCVLDVVDGTPVEDVADSVIDEAGAFSTGFRKGLQMGKAGKFRGKTGRMKVGKLLRTAARHGRTAAAKRVVRKRLGRVVRKAGVAGAAAAAGYGAYRAVRSRVKKRSAGRKGEMTRDEYKARYGKSRSARA